MRTPPWIFVALCAVAAPVWGQVSTANKNPEARRHFQEGVQSAQRGDLQKALQEFEAAYATQPNFSVLYNIAQAHSALAHPVEAATAFERYLAEGGTQVTGARREEVQMLLAATRERIGLLRVLAAGNDARVWIDGIEVLPERLSAPLPLAAGAHAILREERGCEAVSQNALVLAGQTIDLALAPATSCAEQFAQLEIDCELPDVEVLVGGVTKARTPVDAPLLLPSGNVLVQFRRTGYSPVSRSLRLSDQKLTRVACDQHQLSPLPPTVSARLAVGTIPADASVSVDGRSFTGAPLPAGAHRLRVVRDGFISEQRAFSLEAGKTLTLATKLTPTRESLARDQAAAARKQRWGLVLGGTGIALLGTASGLYAWNTQRYASWRDRSPSLNRPDDVGFATSVQRIDDASLAFALLGAGLTGAGAWLFFSP